MKKFILSLLSYQFPLNILKLYFADITKEKFAEARKRANIVHACGRLPTTAPIIRERANKEDINYFIAFIIE